MGPHSSAPRRLRLRARFKTPAPPTQNPPTAAATTAVFSFLYLKKLKISKIFLEKFQKYTPVAL